MRENTERKPVERLNLIYHNIVFATNPKNNWENTQLDYFLRYTKEGNIPISICEIAEWLDSHSIEFSTSFYFVIGYPILSNIRNFFIYLIWKVSRQMGYDWNT